MLDGAFPFRYPSMPRDFGPAMKCSATGELVTPTGAALVRCLSSEFGRPPLFVPRAIGERVPKSVPKYWKGTNEMCQFDFPCDFQHVPPGTWPQASYISLHSYSTTCRIPGIGAGTKDFEKHPNILRVILGQVSAAPPAEEPTPIQEVGTASPSVGVAEAGDWATRQLLVLEANIDDMTGEAAGYLTEKLLEDPKCLDAWLSPILMKKGRPAFTVHVLCEPEDQERFMRFMFTESTTLGVRRRRVERCALRRKTVSVSTAVGDVRVKVGGDGSDHEYYHRYSVQVFVSVAEYILRAQHEVESLARRDWWRNLSVVTRNALTGFASSPGRGLSRVCRQPLWCAYDVK